MSRSCRSRRRPARRRRRTGIPPRLSARARAARPRRVLVRAGARSRWRARCTRWSTCAGCACRPPTRPPVDRAGDRRAAGARRGAPRRARAARAAGPARRRRPRGARARRRLDRRHRRRRPRASAGGDPRRAAAARHAAARRAGGQAARLRAARGRGAGERAGVRRRGRGAGAARRGRRGRRCCAAPGWTCSSPWPRQLADGAAARLVQPLLQWSWMVSLPLRRAERSARPALCAANGQFLVVDAAALARAGGFAAVAGAVLDDLAVARAVKRAGGRVGVADGAGLAACRMYDGWAELSAGYRKSLWAAFGPAPASAAVAAAAGAGLRRAAGRRRGRLAGRAGRLRAPAVASRVLAARRVPAAGRGRTRWPTPRRCRAAGPAGGVVARAPAR